MNTIRKLAGAMLLGAAAVGLAGCATGLRTQVSRYQAMPAPAGQTFYVVPAEGGAQSLEFNRYAALVAQHLQARGYRPAGAPQLATMLVRVDYGIDEGETEYSADPYGRSIYDNPYYRSYYNPLYGRYYGRPNYSRYGYWGARSPYYYGWDDPFWYNSGRAGYGGYGRYGAYGPYGGYGGYDGYGQQGIRSYTVYKSYLELDIVRRADNAPLFEGKAQARSQTDESGILVPNLIEAMFTGFPGRSGETIKITVPARQR